ncbi:HEAT repeat domain-containing protein [Candidatus Poribacteria bacterium]|nr:HEAT repeat domain-containing protein [Candidatus Poribacteria bacterium]
MKPKLYLLVSFCFLLVAGCGSQDEAEEQQKELRYYIEQLRAQDMFLSTEAAFKLADIGEPAVPLLIEALSDENWQVRLNAAVALGQIGDSAAVPALIAALNDEAWEVRANATVALGKMGQTVVPALIAALKDQDAPVRRNAARALGDIGDPTAVPALIEILNDEDGEVRGSAAVALGEMGPVAVPALAAALKDENEAVGAMATWALQLIGTPEALRAVKENEAQKAAEIDEK